MLIGIPLGAISGYYGGALTGGGFVTIVLIAAQALGNSRLHHAPPPTPSWGQMINVGMNFMYFYWHMAEFPTAALAISVLATTLFGDGLRDALDPTLKGR